MDHAAGRVGMQRIEKTVKLRPADVMDSQLLLDWRNDPQTIEMSRQREAVAPDRHQQWLREVMVCPSMRLFIAEDPENGTAVGTGRLNRVDVETVELSLTVDSRLRGRGYGTAIIAALIARVKDEFADARILKAEVRRENFASLRAFARFKFVPARTADGIVEITAPMHCR